MPSELYLCIPIPSLVVDIPSGFLSGGKCPCSIWSRTSFRFSDIELFSSL